jgi:hypothetical protein
VKPSLVWAKPLAIVPPGSLTMLFFSSILIVLLNFSGKRDVKIVNLNGLRVIGTGLTATIAKILVLVIDLS